MSTEWPGSTLTLAILCFGGTFQGFRGSGAHPGFVRVPPGERMPHCHSKTGGGFAGVEERGTRGKRFNGAHMRFFTYLGASDSSDSDAPDWTSFGFACPAIFD